MDASKKLDITALRWTLQSLSEPSKLESFIAAIPSFLGPPTITSETTITLHKLLYTNDADLGLRIGHLLKTKMHMPLACIDTLWHITRWHNAIDVWDWDIAFGQSTVDSLSVLKGSRDPAIALTAHCTAALAAQVLLKKLQHIVPTDIRVHELRRALHLLMDADRGLLELLTHEDLIRDGHVLNMAGILTSAIPLVARVDETRASVLWETLDMVCSGLDARPASKEAQTALVRAWEAYKDESRAWSPAPGGIPYQPPATPATVAAATSAAAAALTTPAAAMTPAAVAETPAAAAEPAAAETRAAAAERRAAAAERRAAAGAEIPAAAAAKTPVAAETPAVATTTSPAVAAATALAAAVAAMAAAAVSTTKTTASARSVDRYKSHMENLVAPIVIPIIRDIGGG